MTQHFTRSYIEDNASSLLLKPHNVGDSFRKTFWRRFCFNVCKDALEVGLGITVLLTIHVGDLVEVPRCRSLITRDELVFYECKKEKTE